MPCAGFRLLSNRLLGLCIRCARQDDGARTLAATPELRREGRCSTTWCCDGWVPAKAGV